MPRGRFVNRPYETLENQGLLASLFDSNGNRNGHTNHGVVTCADQTHHLNALVPSLTHGVVKKPYKISFLSCKILAPNTSYSIFLKTLYRILMSP